MLGRQEGPASPRHWQATDNAVAADWAVPHSVRDGGTSELEALHREYVMLARARDELEISREMYRSFFEHAPVAMLCFDEYAVITNANQTAAQALKRPLDNLIGKPAVLCVSQRSRRRLLSHIRRVSGGVADTVEIELLARDETITPVLLRSVPVPGVADSATHCQSAALDISERKLAETQLQSARDHLAHLAHHDTLTGLPNRRMFLESLDQALLRACRQHSRGALLFLDLDNFKALNDSLGHQVGDSLLVEVARRLRAAVAGRDTVCRLGGDEFTVIVEDIPDVESVNHLAARINASLRSCMQIGGRDISVGTSIGVRLFPEPGLTAEDLISQADMAMYEAKAAGRGNVQHFQAAMQATIRHQGAIASDLFQALDREEFELAYQAQYASDTRRIVGVEALVRWNHPRLGQLLPGEFIPMAEFGGQIRELGEWVLQQACTDFVRWQQLGLAPGRLAVNLSPQQFEAPDLPARISHILAMTGLAPDCLELELTETTVTRDPVFAATVLGEMRNKGIHIAMDDFGTGYSSLSQLRHFPLTRLKIDSSFIAGVPDNNGDRSIADAIIAMAHNLDLTVVSEGVETTAQAAYLQRAGCDALQGYFLCRPVDATTMAAMLRR